MREFFDTSVLVPAFLPEHPHHLHSAKLLLGADPTRSCISSHSLAELYSTLTRMPLPHRLAPEQAIQAIRVCARKLTLQAIAAEEIETVLEQAATLNVRGGTTYDYLIAACAAKAKAEVIYTWNLRHYELFGAEIVQLLRTPDHASGE